VDLTNPFEGLFVKRGRRYKYTINHTKKVYYSLDETAVLYPDHTRSDFLDPLLILMGYEKHEYRNEETMKPYDLW